ncbi:DNA-binding transcriptional LysR family regulator [Actinoplanes tereljensis]|uniref:LysR family transcriptional regulator n=1 Tax=Paractinoplanes tereljensis TaxID=571912 RepID=A0A919NLS9_9ACTN|nr:LysR family transcriptional regulator [Actinoplanes tereljensis]GIF20177.1 LysR family transcriptional regulator [Actinoplanes tereljensis]
METRELRYFVAVAEELHFGRAADRLGITQPSLSRAIGQLEEQLGTTLLDRTSRKVALTAAGTVLLDEGRAVLGALAAAGRRTRQAGTSRPSLVLATKTGTSDQLLTKLLDAYAAEPGAVPVDLLLCESHTDQALHDGRADVALLHQPFDSVAGLDTEVLSTEQQVAILPAAHPYATRPHLRLAEVTSMPELPPARWPGPDGTYPDGPGAEAHNQTQLLQLVALGRTTAILPESCRANLREGLVAVPVVDAPAVIAVIAWPAHSRSRTVADLVRAATRHFST